MDRQATTNITAPFFIGSDEDDLRRIGEILRDCDGYIPIDLLASQDALISKNITEEDLRNLRYASKYTPRSTVLTIFIFRNSKNKTPKNQTREIYTFSKTALIDDHRSIKLLGEIDMGIV